MRNRRHLVSYFAAATLVLVTASIGAPTHAEDRWNGYDTGVGSSSILDDGNPLTKAEENAPTRLADSEALESDVPGSGSSIDTYAVARQVDRVYREIFQPGNPWAQLNTK